MRGQLGVGGVDLRVVVAGLGHPGLQIVGDGDLSDAPVRLPGVHVRHQPALQLLGGTGLGVDHPRGAQHRDEHLVAVNLAAGRVNPGGSLVAAEIDEHPLPAGIRQAHHHVGGVQPLGVVVTEAAVTPAVGVGLFPLQPQQPQCHMAVLALELLVHRSPIRDRPQSGRDRHRRREQGRLERLSGHALGQRPAQPGPLRPGQVLAHRGLRHGRVERDLTLRQALRVQAQDFGDLSHR